MLSLANSLYRFCIAVGAYTAPLALLCILLGLSFRKTSSVFGHILMVTSYIWAAGLWLGSAINVYTVWGFTGFVIGVLMFGVGVIPLAIIAQLTHGYPSGALVDVATIVAIVGARFFGAYLASRQQGFAKAAATS